MRRFNAVIVIVGLVCSLCAAPAGAADQKNIHHGYDPTGPTCHLGHMRFLVKGFFAEEGLRVRGIARSTIALPSPRADPIGSG